MGQSPGRGRRKTRNAVTLWLIAAAILAVALLSAAWFLRYKGQEAKRYDLAQISKGSYSGAFFSMYPIDHYSADDFTYFYAWTPVLSSYSIPTAPVLAEYLDALFASNNQVIHVCLGLDPYRLWQSSGQSDRRWNKNLRQYLLSYFEEYSSVNFYVILPYPSVEYWLTLKERTLQETMDVYRKMLDCLEPYENVRVYFPGSQQWLIDNPANYEGDFLCNSLVSRLLTAYISMDDLLIDSANAEEFISQLYQLIARQKEGRDAYPDYSRVRMVFLGDSVIGNFGGSLSVPGVVAGLSGASVYNYAIGGTHATFTGNRENSFLEVIDDFLGKNLPPSQDSAPFPYDAQDASQEELCFLIHYGLNDYFDGYPVANEADPYDVHTFSGALRTGIQRLREAYPQAHILLMTPPFCTYFSNGTQINQEGGGCLTDYVEAVVRAAQAEDVLYMNDYVNLGITAENYETYSSDGCHLNETGRYLLGYQIVFALYDALTL